MKTFFAAALLLALTLPAFARADVPAIASGTIEDKVANVAASIFSVTDLKIGKLAIKVIAMDAETNGDLNSTTIVLVGEGAVGGAAGYDAAFKMSPNDNARNLKSASVQNGLLVLAFYDEVGKVIKTRYSYDAASKSLKQQ